MRWMLMLIIFLAACHDHQSTEITDGKGKKKIRDASYLFFRNVRQPYYNVIEETGPEKRISFRLKAFGENTDPRLTLLIMIDWKNDLAFLRLEDKPGSSEASRILFLPPNPGIASGDTLCIGPEKTGQTHEIITLGEWIDRYDTINILENGRSVPLSIDRELRESYRIIMKDFQRLTGNI